jgi:hypothetical protein
MYVQNVMYSSKGYNSKMILNPLPLKVHIRKTTLLMTVNKLREVGGGGCSVFIS